MVLTSTAELPSKFAHSQLEYKLFCPQILIPRVDDQGPSTATTGIASSLFDYTTTLSQTALLIQLPFSR